MTKKIPYNHNKRKEFIVGCDELTIRMPFLVMTDAEILACAKKLYRVIDTNGIERKPVAVKRDYDVPIVVWEIPAKKRK